VARRPAVETDPGLRASDADREQVVSRLREHAADGRLDVAELEQRIDAAYAARTQRLMTRNQKPGVAIDERVRTFADDYWDQVLELKPILATEVGDERFDDRLPDLSEGGRARAASTHQQALRKLARFEVDLLDSEGRTALLMVEGLARAELAALEHRFDRFDALSHMWGPGTLLATLGSLQQANSSEGLERYLSRLRSFRAYLEAAVELVREAAASGQMPSRIVVERTIAQVEALLDAGADRSPALNAIAEGYIDGRMSVIAVLRAVVLPAYQRYLDAVRAVREWAPEAFGLWALPGGDEIYRAKVLAWNSAALDPEELHRFGQEELPRLAGERAEIAGRLGYRTPEEALAAAEASGATTLQTRDEILALARDQVELSWARCPDFFGRMPAANCEVRAVDPSRENDVLDHYLRPSADGSRPGVYYVNTLPGRSVHSLASTTYHEANPGHHLQTALEQAYGERPAIRRFASDLVASAFVEGWALYSERLADEMGLFESEYERLGMLEQQTLRAVRLVVDTGIHVFGWTREQAVGEMQQTGMTPEEIAIEVDRYAALPAQALTYKVGQRAIEELRAKAQQREGAAFSLKGFHDRLLALGSLPLDGLAREMEHADGHDAA